jgi:hypothetical protein
MKQYQHYTAYSLAEYNAVMRHLKAERFQVLRSRVTQLQDGRLLFTIAATRSPIARLLNFLFPRRLILVGLFKTASRASDDRKAA